MTCTNAAVDSIQVCVRRNVLVRDEMSLTGANVNSPPVLPNRAFPENLGPESIYTDAGSKGYV